MKEYEKKLSNLISSISTNLENSENENAENQQKKNLNLEKFDLEKFVDAIKICNYPEQNQINKKCKKYLYDLFCKENYKIFFAENSNFNFNFYKNKKNFTTNENKFVEFFLVLHNLDLTEKDLKIIQEKYFLLKENFNIENFLWIFDALFFYDTKNLNVENLKKDIFDVLSKCYLSMTNENNHLFNSNLIFYNPKDISNFSLLAMEKLLQYTNLNYMQKLLGLRERIILLQPLPKILFEINKSEMINDKLKGKIQVNSTEIFLKFLKNIPKNEINELELYLLSNIFFYSKLPTEIFELFLEGFFKNINLQKFTIESLLEIFFLILQVTEKKEKISLAKEKLVTQLFLIFSTHKQNEVFYFAENKFDIYMKICKKNLKEVLAEWELEKEIKAVDNDRNNKEFLNAFKMIVELSIKLGPFSTKDVCYNKEQIEFMYLNFKRIIKKI